MSDLAALIVSALFTVIVLALAVMADLGRWLA